MAKVDVKMPEDFLLKLSRLGDKTDEICEKALNAGGEVDLAKVRAYREGRHGSEKWANRATFSTATDLFRFRCIPHIEITTDMLILCDNRKFEITSVENVKGRNMYIEVLAKEVKPSG